MSVIYADVLRVEGSYTGAAGITGGSGITGLAQTIRNKQVGFENDETHRMIHLEAGGSLYHWTPDETLALGADDISYISATESSIENVEEALDFIIDRTANAYLPENLIGVGNDTDNMIGLSGLQYDYTKNEMSIYSYTGAYANGGYPGTVAKPGAIRLTNGYTGQVGKGVAIGNNSESVAPWGMALHVGTDFANHDFDFGVTGVASILLEGMFCGGYVKSSGEIDVGTDLTVSGSAYLTEYMYHEGDPNTYLRLRPDQISLVAGGDTVLDMTPSLLTITGLTKLQGDQAAYFTYFESSLANLGMGTLTPFTGYSSGQPNNGIDLHNALPEIGMWDTDGGDRYILRNHDGVMSIFNDNDAVNCAIFDSTKLEIPANSAIYIGAEGTNNTWRILISGTDLTFERRVGGSYVSKGSISA